MHTKSEKPKLKHNKKRNTAFIFESLVKELTRAVVYGQRDRQKLISGLIKEHFKKNGPLDRELSLYKQIYETKQFPKQFAEKLIDQVKDEHDQLDESEIYNEQSKLIAKINKTLGTEFYNNFVPNYKTLATISQIFNRSTEPRKRVLLEQELLEHVTANEEGKKLIREPVNKFTYNRFIERFNETYNNALLPEQKELLSKYMRHNEDDIDLKVYLNEEIGRIKNELSKIKGNDLIKENTDLENKVTRMQENLQTLKIETISEELIKKVMLMQEFVCEVNK